MVDNNSTDDTSKIAKKYKVRVIFEPKQGISFARNAGFDAAKYDIILRCDADTRIPQDWVKKVKADFEKWKVDAVAGIATLFDNPLKTNISTKKYMDIMKIILNGQETLLGPNMAVTKKIWQKVRDEVCMDNDEVHEDIDLGIHILRVGGKIKRDNHLTVEVSARRWLSNPRSGFIEYPTRIFKTLKKHDIIFSAA